MTKPDVGAMYEPFAHRFHEHAADSAYNAHYDRPAMLDLVGDVAGKDVLDVGCGSGHYTAALVDAGARVTAFDAWCEEFAQAGFLIERLVEPQPAESMRERDPAAFDRLSRQPGFIAFRLLRT